MTNQRQHPGRGRKRSRPTLKGRQVETAARAQVCELLGVEADGKMGGEADYGLRRDWLIEYLHAIQDHYGQLTHRHLAALAAEMKIAQAEVYEVATFYAHFDVVADDTTPPATTIRVCDSIACQLAGAEALFAQLQQHAPVDIRVLRAPCMGRCECAPAAEVGHRHIAPATAESLLTAAAKGETAAVLPDYLDFDQYRAAGGYALLQACLAGERTPDQIIDLLSAANLKGLGGAGFPTGKKWSIVRNFPAPRMMAVNGDEGEPGTFKDRIYLEHDPHRMLEGLLIAAWAVAVDTCYVYIRDEYPSVISLLKTELARAQAAGLCAHVQIEIRRGAGAYICGEESAMIESIEGKRGLPRNRPPYVAEVGLFGRPTLANNVETLYWVRAIVEKGADWFATAGGKGGEERRGWRSYSVSGRVQKPGLKLAPAGISVRALIDQYCGGMLAGHRFKGYLPGGASGGILPATLGDVPLDFGTLQPHGGFIGSAAVVIFSEHDNMQEVALNLMRFFRDESCGQCTPCRVGTEKAVLAMEQSKWDPDLLRDLSTVMTDASICGLGQAAGNPINCVLQYFPEDL